MTPTELWIYNHHAAARDQSTGTRHFDLASRLVRHGWSVTIFAAGFNHFTGREERLTGWRLLRTEIIDGVRFVWIRTTPYRGNGIGRMINMASYFIVGLLASTRRPRPSQVIGSTVHPLAAVLGWVVAHRRGVPFHFEIRDLWPQTLIDIGALRDRSLAARAMRGIERLLAERANTVIAVLPGIESYLRERKIAARRVVYIPNGVVLSGSERERTASRTAARIAAMRADGRFVVIYAGAHAIHNRLEVVLDAARLVADGGHDRITFVLIGDGPQKAMLIDRARSLNLPNLELLPPVPKHEIRTVLESGDACLLHMTRTPVYRYGISFNKLFDYLASARPVIFACETSYDPVALASCGLSVPPDNPAALREAVVQLAATDPDERDRMGRRAYDYVAAHHDMDVLARKLMTVLRA